MQFYLHLVVQDIEIVNVDQVQTNSDLPASTNASNFALTLHSNVLKMNGVGKLLPFYLKKCKRNCQSMVYTCVYFEIVCAVDRFMYICTP